MYSILQYVVLGHGRTALHSVTWSIVLKAVCNSRHRMVKNPHRVSMFRWRAYLEEFSRDRVTLEFFPYFKKG